MVNESGGEGVAGANGVGDFDGEARMLMMGVGGDDETAFRAASDANEANAEFAAEPAGGVDFGIAARRARGSVRIDERGRRSWGIF